MKRSLLVLAILFSVGCDITQPVAPTPGDSNNDVDGTNQINIDIDIDNDRNDGDQEDKEENRAPIVTIPSNLEHTAGDSVAIPVNVFDPDGDPFACTMAGAPRGLQISSDCLISGQITSSSGGQVFLTTVTASDGLATGRGQTTWNVLEPEE